MENQSTVWGWVVGIIILLVIVAGVWWWSTASSAGTTDTGASNASGSLTGTVEP